MKKLIVALSLLLCAVSCVKPQSTCDWSKSVVYELNVRQYTPQGTFAAAQQQLPRLKELGVDIVWIMPFYPIGELNRKGTLGSYYSIRNYCDVNPEFGTLADFDNFVAAAHKLGLKVIIDWVANHTSPDHPWVSEKPADWYFRDAAGNTIIEYDWTDIAKLNYDNKDLREAMQQNMLFWLNRGIDGYRCDMACLVPQDFWTPTIEMLRERAGKPLYFLAEGEEPWLHEAGFDASYSWRLHHLINDIAQGKATRQDLQEYLKWNEENFPNNALRLVFTSNHDENSWAGTEFERMGDKVAELTELMWFLPNAQPLIYTGQEIGLDRRLKFFEKDSITDWSSNSWTSFYQNLTARFHLNPIKRIEPLNWWVGMKTPLQLLVQADSICKYDVSIAGRGIFIKSVEQAQSPNYIFVNVGISRTALPGEYNLVFTNKTNPADTFTVPYRLKARRQGSAERESFGPRDAIYLLMPDRFSNGNPANDNSPLCTEQADTKAFFGRHGGDICGIRSHLDYISDLGMTAIWCTPLLEDNQPRESYHGYACTDYYHIDSRFGTNAEYAAFVQDAHAHGIKVISDVVTNHCGSAHWWMKDLPFADWIHQWSEYTHSNCSFSMQNSLYNSQFDLKNMQEGWFDTSMPDMNLDNPFVLQYFKQWAVWIIENFDLDGFRVDTFPYNEKMPVSDWCAAVRAEYPNIDIVGEVWSTNVPQVAYWQDDNPNPDGYDSNLPSIMDFGLQSILWQLNQDKTYWEEGVTKVFESIANDIYYKNPSNMMIFPGNHDTDRIADVLNGDASRVKIVMTLMATLRGFPQIFAGDEYMAASKDRSQGHGGLRVQFDENWALNPVAKDVHDYTATLLNWRKNAPAIWSGRTVQFLSRDNTYAYFRIAPEQTVFVYINNNPYPVSIPWGNYSEVTVSLPGIGKNVVTGADFDPAVEVPSKSSIVIEF